MTTASRGGRRYRIEIEVYQEKGQNFGGDLFTNTSAIPIREDTKTHRFVVVIVKQQDRKDSKGETKAGPEDTRKRKEGKTRQG